WRAVQAEVTRFHAQRRELLLGEGASVRRGGRTLRDKRRHAAPLKCCFAASDVHVCISSNNTHTHSLLPSPVLLSTPAAHLRGLYTVATPPSELIGCCAAFDTRTHACFETHIIAVCVCVCVCVCVFRRYRPLHCCKSSLQKININFILIYLTNYKI
ncbi:hypothetical protein LDENG_00130860, partial [Lucifuga dentata]